MKSVKDEIKQKLSIVDVVSLYVTLKPAGKNFVGLSPFTKEKTPSFYVSPDRDLYYCFSTSQGGDMFTLVQKMEGVDFRGALKILAEKAGVSLDSYNQKTTEERDVLFAVMEEATRFFEGNLSRTVSAIEYLKKRGLTERTIALFRVGFAPVAWRDLHTHLSRSFSEEHLEKAGLIKRGEKGLYDRFRSRIMFPISDTSGRVIAFSGRIFIEDEARATEDQKNAAKYLNSPDTPLFNKSEVFFGLDKAKHAIKKYDFAILVEGQMDLLMLHQIGYTNTVAASGTALTSETVTEEGLVSHMGLLVRLTKNLVLAYDSDRAGVNAARKAFRIALSLGMTTKVVEMPPGYDPADYVKEFGRDGWASVVKQAVSVFEMLARRICVEEEDQLRRIRRIRDEVLPELTLLPSAVEQGYYLDAIAQIAGIPKHLLQKDFDAMEIPNLLVSPETDLSQTKKHTTIPHGVSRAFGLLWYLEDTHDTERYELFSRFLETWMGKLYTEWLRRCEPHKEEFMFQVEVELGKDTTGSHIERQFFEDSAQLILRYLRPLYHQTIQRLELQGNQSTMNDVMGHFNQLVRMIENTLELQKELYGTKKENS